MKKDVSISYVFIVSFITALLVLLLVVINVNGPFLKKNNKDIKSTTTSTTKKITTEKVNSIEIIDSIRIEGEPVEFKATIYKSKLGFQINYDKEFFVLKEFENKVIFENVYNKDNYVEIEEISFEDYKKRVRKKDDSEPCEKAGYTYTYKFEIYNNKYFRIIESLIDDAEYHGLAIRMDYMVSSLQSVEE